MINGLQWLVQDNSVNYLIEYRQTLPGNKVIIAINGATEIHDLLPDDSQGYTAEFQAGGQKCRLQIAADSGDMALTIDDQVQKPLEPVAEIAGPATSAHFLEQEAWQKKIKSGMSSFLMLIILSLVNIVLIWLNASISFPFSIFTSGIAFAIGQSTADETGSVVFLIAGVVFSGLMIAIYAVLYKLAGRRIWPVWTALALIIIDSLILVAFALMGDELLANLLDMAFHVWIIASLARLGQCKVKLNRLVKASAANAADQVQTPVQTAMPE